MIPLQRAGISVGELVGYRIWEVHLVDGVETLRSWVYPCFWLPGIVMADITHEVIGKEEGGISDYNERGVWAFKTQELLDNFVSDILQRNKLICGSCYMWGTIIEHELGYRSQYARPRTLDSCVYSHMIREETDMDALRKRYFL